jgi:hypothetical protein
MTGEVIQMDVESVHSYASGFARAVVANDIDLVLSYLSKDTETEIRSILAAVPHPVIEAEILNVITPGILNGITSDDEECVTVTKFSGDGGEALMRAVWVEPLEELLIKDAWIVAVAGGGQGAERNAS